MSRAFALVVVEGALEIPVSMRLLQAAGVPVVGLHFVNKGGSAGFWRDIRRYNRAAACLGPVLGLADLEAFPCPSGLITRYFKGGKHADFVLRIAERMLESWLLADVEFAAYLKVPPTRLPRYPDREIHPKRTLVNLARRSTSRGIRSDLVPAEGSLGVVGKGYSTRMTQFVECHWEPTRAQGRSESLRRALVAVRKAANS